MKRLIAIGLVWAAASACGSPPRPARGVVRVAAASDLNAALGDLIERFSAAHAVDVSAAFGSSGTFFAQLMNGAPFDLFLSADVEYPRRLAERGLTVEGSEFLYAVGRLVLWTPASSSLNVREKGVRIVADPAVKRVAIANPDHAPYGRAAVAALRAEQIYDAVRPKIAIGENVAQTLQFAQSGAADAAFVALSLALAPHAKGGAWIEVPAGDYPRIEQGGVILRGARDLESARALRAYLLGPDARAILQQYGFALPDR